MEMSGPFTHFRDDMALLSIRQSFSSNKMTVDIWYFLPPTFVTMFKWRTEYTYRKATQKRKTTTIFRFNHSTKSLIKYIYKKFGIYFLGELYSLHVEQTCRTRDPADLSIFGPRLSGLWWCSREKSNYPNVTSIGQSQQQSRFIYWQESANTACKGGISGQNVCLCTTTADRHVDQGLINV